MRKNAESGGPFKAPLVLKVDELSDAGVDLNVRLGQDWLAAVLPPAYRCEEGATLKGRLDRSEDNVLLSARIQFSAACECSRCATPMDMPASFAVSSLYVPAEKDKVRLGGLEVDSDDTFDELCMYENGLLDLEPQVAQTVTLGLPPYPLCSEDCRGLCPVCGAELNKESCDCLSRQDNSQFVKLGSLLAKK